MAIYIGNTKVPTIDSIGGKTGDITLDSGISIDSDNKMSVSELVASSYATSSDITNLYASDTKKFIVLSNIETLVTTLMTKVVAWVAELRTLINTKVSSVKVDGTAILDANYVADLGTTASSTAYNKTTNPIVLKDYVDTASEDSVKSSTSGHQALEIWQGTKDQYDDIENPSADTLYVITSLS